MDGFRKMTVQLTQSDNRTEEFLDDCARGRSPASWISLRKEWDSIDLHLRALMAAPENDDTDYDEMGRLQKRLEDLEVECRMES